MGPKTWRTCVGPRWLSLDETVGAVDAEGGVTLQGSIASMVKRATWPARQGHAAGWSVVDSGFPRTTTYHNDSPHPLEVAMKYLCLIYENEKSWETMPPADSEAIMNEYFTFTADIQKNGKLVAGEALQPTATATTVRVRNGKVSTTDGPFAETKEQLGGFYLIEAKDLNDAIQVAAKIPSARLGTIEVRPVVDFSAEAAQREEAAGARA